MRLILHDALIEWADFFSFCGRRREVDRWIGFAVSLRRPITCAALALIIGAKIDGIPMNAERVRPGRTRGEGREGGGGGEGRRGAVGKEGRDGGGVLLAWENRASAASLLPFLRHLCWLERKGRGGSVNAAAHVFPSLPLWCRGCLFQIKATPQLFAFGVANLAGSIFSALPGSASLSRGEPL